MLRFSQLQAAANLLQRAAQAGAAYRFVQNELIQVSRHRLPPRTPGDPPLRMLCIADLHGKLFGGDGSWLLRRARLLQPDFIVLPGDTVSADCHNLAATAVLLRALGEVAPCFLIPGNHEHRSGRWADIRTLYQWAGVTVLQNQRCDLVLRGVPLHILGLDEGMAVSRLDYLREACHTLHHRDFSLELRALARQDGLRVVLSHFPECFARIGFQSYRRFDFDLMVSGHAHGGHVRLGRCASAHAPSLFAAGQGFFPPYTAGIYGAGPRLLVSRGLGNDSPIPRIQNRPELVLVTFGQRQPATSPK